LRYVKFKCQNIIFVFHNVLILEIVSILPDKKTTFNVDNVRVSKILGGSLYQSQVVQGMVFKRQVEGDITRVEKAKIAVYTCPIDSVQTETKGTVLIQSSKELIDFSRGEENMLEKEIAAIAAAGVKVIVSGGKIGDLCLHYLNKYGIMGVRLQSKFDIRRLCKAINATALPRLVNYLMKFIVFVKFNFPYFN
jgi:T-complex protein 1 subunit theta